MSDQNSPEEEKNKSQLQGLRRGHPQQQQGHVPNQEQVGVVDHHRRKPANDADDINNPQAQKERDAHEALDKDGDKTPPFLGEKSD